MANSALGAVVRWPAPGRSFPRREDAVAAHAQRQDADSDGALLLQVAASNGLGAQALEELFFRHAEALAAFLDRMVRNPQEVEDLVQDTFVLVAEKAGSYRGESSFRTWLFALALNLLRTRKRREALAEKADNRVIAQNPHLVTPRSDSDPLWGLEQQELRERLGRAIGRLAPAERETFLFYWFGEFSYAEISRLTGVSIPAAKVRVHRALARLADMLAEFRPL